MPHKISTQLSPLQKKVLEELDLITDAYISTFSEIGKITKYFSEEINAVIHKFLSEKGSWKKYPSQCYELSYKPFTYVETEKFSLNLLDPNFTVNGRTALTKAITKGGKTKYLNYFSLEWGFYYGRDEHPDRYFYFIIDRNAKSYGGPIMVLQEYEKILKNKQRYLNFECDQQHPLKGDSSEYIELRLDYKHINQLSDFLKFFKENLLTTFLSKIKD